MILHIPGAMTDMPAVKVFSLYASAAVFFDFVLQVTCFLALMTLDARRAEANRMDICCCSKDQAVPPESTRSDGVLFKFTKKYYSPWLLADWVRPIVVLVFVGWAAFSLAMVHNIKVGLDQKLSMPEDSYVLDYFKVQ